MDSCHLFNFLFGTKKATTELSRCFSNLNGQSSGQSTSGASREPRAPPPSPLKQLQIKIVALATSSSSSANKKSPTKPVPTARLIADSKGSKVASSRGDDEPACGTYRATLIESAGLEDENADILPSPSAINDNQDPKFKLMEVIESPSGRSITTIAREQVAPPEDKTPDGSVPVSVSITSQPTAASQRPYCRQVVLYDDESSRANERVVSSSAQVFKFVSTPEASASANPSAELSRLVDWESPADCNDDTHSSSRNLDTSNTNKNYDNQVLKDKRSAYVRNIVQSFETSSRTSIETVDLISPRQQRSQLINRRQLSRGNTIDGSTPSARLTAKGTSELIKQRIMLIDINNNQKPTTIVKPMPPKTPPKSSRAKYFTWQLINCTGKAQRIEQLVEDESFLVRLFDQLEPLDRCVAAQVCRTWRNILYSKHEYWKDLVSVIDCTQLRREQLVECIMSTLQSAKRKQLTSSTANGGQVKHHDIKPNAHQRVRAANGAAATLAPEQTATLTPSSGAISSITTEASGRMLEHLDQEDIWRIQELCNRFTHRNATLPSASRVSQYQIPNCAPQPPASNQHQTDMVSNGNQEQQTVCQASKSSSIPSQISSTFSSVSLSSLLSPLSESSRVEFMKEKLYSSVDERGFDAICLFGATDEDIEDLMSKMPSGAHKRILVGRLNNCCVTDRGLELFVSAFTQLEELELSGCNEITNGIELKKLLKLRSLIVTDCINIADGFAQRVVQIMDQLDELTIQAYHLTDAFIEFLSLNADTSNLKRLELPDCKEITNQSLMIIAKHLSHLEALSLSGSTKICDDGIEILAEQATRLQSLDLSWCTKISDASLECIACDLGATLTDLILDRNVRITDSGLGYLTTMSKLTLLHIRWCPRITDLGLEAILPIRSLRYLSIAGLQRLTARSLLCLVESNLLEVELTNCQAANSELQQYLASRMPECRVIF